MLPLFVAAFVLGACLLQTQAALPDWRWSLFLLLPLLTAIFAQYTFAKYAKKLRIIALIIVMFGGGFYYATWRAELRLAQQIPQHLIWRDIIVEGTVRGFANNDGRRTRFDFDIDKIIKPPMPFSLRVRLADYHFKKPPLAGLQNGARLKLKIRIRPPRQNANPHGFDYGEYLFANGIRAAGYIRARDSAVLLEAGGGFRDSLRQQTQKISAHGDLLAALIVGDRSGIDENEWRVLRRTGTAHLMSISGTHITLAAGLAALLAGFLWRRNRRLMRWMPAQKAALIAAVPMALIYALLAGFGVPVQRSFLMFLAVAAAILSGGMSSILQTMSVAALVVIIVDPWAVLSAGFWLSFALAAAVVFAVASGKIVWKLLRLQLLVSVFALPLTLWFFNEASLVSPLANAIAIPLTGFIILPLALADIILPGDILWQAADLVLSVLWIILEFLSELPFASWRASTPWWLFVPAFAGGLWFLMPRGIPLRWAGIFPMVAMLLWQPSPPPVGDFRMTVLDVGQGASIAIETTKRTLIYDAGPGYAFRIIDTFLHGNGRRRLDMLMISHDNFDHSGAAERLLQTIPIDIFSSSMPPSHTLAKQSAYYEFCRAGRQWQWDGVLFEVLHPPVGYDNSAANALSCVLKITGKNGSALLTGDIPESVELQLLKESPQILNADILLAAHHGSKYSSSSLFLQAVSPQAAVFSAGANNRYGHPHPDALQRMRQSGAAIYNTAQDGAIIIETSADNIKIIKWAEQKRRYWQTKYSDEE